MSVWPPATASTTSTSTARTAPRSSPTFGQASEPTWHLDDQANDRVRRGELTTEASFVRREVGQEVLVDQPERITGQLARQRSEEPEQLTEGGLLKSLIATGQDVTEFGVGGFDGFHRLVDRLAKVLALRQPDET